MAVDPEPPVGIDHHFDDSRIDKRGCDRVSHGGAQHRPLPVEGCGVKAVSHRSPPPGRHRSRRRR